jgi:hypothetical protein
MRRAVANPLCKKNALFCIGLTKLAGVKEGIELNKYEYISTFYR